MALMKKFRESSDKDQLTIELQCHTFTYVLWEMHSREKYGILL